MKCEKACKHVGWGRGELVASKERCDAPVRSSPQGREPDVDEAPKDKLKEVHHY